MFIIIICILFGYSNGQFPDSEYCSIPCDNGQHTMCAYAPVSSHCLHVESLMDPRRRQKILSLHNSFRNAVAGGTHPAQKTMNAPSSNMRQLYWDLELEGIAKRWASQCNISSNDDCRDVARFTVGQVMSKSEVLTPSLDYYDMLFNLLWFAEVENLSKTSLLKYRKQRNIKHVAQILHANTMRVGCTDVITKRAQGRKAIRVTICNYGPAIISGEELYKIGHPCSNCPVGTMCRGPYSKYPHLCSEYRQFDIAEVKPNFLKIQMDYGSDDASVLPDISMKADIELSNLGLHSRYIKENDGLSYGQRKLGNEDSEQDQGLQEDNSEMDTESRYLGLDDQNDGLGSRTGARFVEEDPPSSGNGFQDDQSLFGGRQLDLLDAGRALENSTETQPIQTQPIARSGGKVGEVKTEKLGTGNATQPKTSETSASPHIHPSHWYITPLFSTLVKFLTITKSRTL